MLITGFPAAAFGTNCYVLALLAGTVSPSSVATRTSEPLLAIRAAVWKTSSGPVTSSDWTPGKATMTTVRAGMVAWCGPRGLSARTNFPLILPSGPAGAWGGYPGAMSIRRRVVAHGRVQGVFFRDATRRRAETRGVAGWVSNRSDGAVEAVFEGEPDAVESMLRFAVRGRATPASTTSRWSRRSPRGSAASRCASRLSQGRGHLVSGAHENERSQP